MATAAHNLESQILAVTFVLQLYDGFTGEPELAGNVTAEVSGRERGWRKPDRGQFAFFRLPAGNHVVQVRDTADPPRYFGVDIAVTLPLSTPLWPAFPDRALADPTLPLNDPGQPAAYRAQLAPATLAPTAQYAFPAGATLARGTIRSGAVPLAGAHVSRQGEAREYVTGDDGQYVLWFSSVAGTGEAAVIEATHPAHAPASAPVTLRRGSTTIQDISMV